MKAVILAGGYGTRISEETVLKPKPMVEIGSKPILWHIMKYYSCFGIKDFVICLGYKGYVIKEFFTNYYTHNADIKIDLKNNSTEILNSSSEDWTITLVDTGHDSMTGGRVKRIQPYVKDERFLLTYGDGLSNIKIDESIKFHEKQKSILTLTATRPGGRFGILDITDDERVSSFREKRKEDSGWVNGGFFIAEPEIFNYIDADSTVFEKYPLETLAKEGNLSAFKHNDFWAPMDTIKDRADLEALWESGKAPWKIW